MPTVSSTCPAVLTLTPPKLKVTFEHSANSWRGPMKIVWYQGGLKPDSPKGYVDEVHGRHLGSRAIVEAIERRRPALVVCGHIHQCWGGEAAIGTTPVVNVGPEGRFFEL